jgi:hypothetical protein
VSPASPEPEFETSFTDLPVCPYCGTEVREPHELFIGNPHCAVEHDCHGCGGPFFVEEYVDVKYCTEKKEKTP